MAPQYILSLILLLTYSMVQHCASAAVHSHAVEQNQERESDGSYKSRDHDHYNEGEHNSEFDHEAILGSVKEAEEFDKLKPEESRRRLAQLLPLMDLNRDQTIDKAELKAWILNSFVKLSKEEATERMSEVDTNKDGLVTWKEYMQDAFGADDEDEVGPDDTGETGMVDIDSRLQKSHDKPLVREEKIMWDVADTDGDGTLNFEEFKMFSNPEEHPIMHPFLVNQTLKDKDEDGDGYLEFHEYLGARGTGEDKAWLVSEKEKFDDLDSDGDGRLDEKEIMRWMIPDNEEIAGEEVDHLFSTADDDRNDVLSFEEILDHHDVFVGSEVTDYGSDLYGEHFADEL
ncbi:reticulocalbin-2-like isoform X2 [Plodia interpunctella]|uniref:reticulocalbin-2-like isoform X2 n=1 Tax=Plodia interpunctella TaxID=58824 RepID=UPI002367609B|nr:reticulocalbin-2-like isoform X2 [Plodia interpunctella]